MSPLADTGRIKAPLARKAQRLYYGPPDDAADRAELALIARVDRAHLVMLAEQRIIPVSDAASLLRTIAALQEDDFAAVVGRDRPRGLYLAYEHVISDLAGPATGGVLHTGRSRNDLNATLALLTVRRLGLEVLAEGVRLLTAMLRAAERELDTVMAIHTHYQPAMPITYGYYLTGVALALHRGLDRLLGALRGIVRCPLGAHAVAGTDLPLDTARTAVLLGFDAGPVHAVDAIASRDVSADAVGAAAGIAVTVSRLATDLQLWNTAESSCVAFPDWLVGSSSAMPQKRNAFLLEYLKGRPAILLSAWVNVLSATKSTPFTNSIEVGAEAMRPVVPALRTTQEVLAMAALVVAGAEPVPARSTRVAADNYVDATAHANAMVRRGVPFREAHQRVGSAVLQAIENGGPWPPGDLPPIDLRTAVDDSRYGGGPGARGEALAYGWKVRHALSDELRTRRRQIERAEAALQRSVQRLIAGDLVPEGGR